MIVVDFSSELTKSIIHSAQNEEIVSINLSEFREIVEINNGQPEVIYYHKNVTIIDYDDESDNYTERSIDTRFLCMNCRTDINMNVPIEIPNELYLGINHFKEILNQIELECSYCGQKGFAGDVSKFELIQTSGLDEDLSPRLSSHEKRQWYYSLDFIFQHYLKEIFKINIYENTGYAVDFFECRFVLTNKTIVEKKEFNLVFYNTGAIILQNGKEKKVEGKYPFMCKVGLGKEIPDELIVNPKNYSAKEKQVTFPDGSSIPFPLLEMKTD